MATQKVRCPLCFARVLPKADGSPRRHYDRNMAGARYSSIAGRCPPRRSDYESKARTP